MYIWACRRRRIVIEFSSRRRKNRARTTAKNKGETGSPVRAALAKTPTVGRSLYSLHANDLPLSLSLPLSHPLARSLSLSNTVKATFFKRAEKERDGDLYYL